MIASLLAIVTYVLGSLGFYSIANRRGIKNAWLAWVPIGNGWLLGCISDQYQSVKYGKHTNKRTALLVLNIIYCLSAVVLVVLCIVLMVQMIIADGGLDMSDPGAYNGAYSEPIYGEYEAQVDELPAEMMGPMFGMLGAYVVLMLSFLPMMIVQYIALYDLFNSCDPNSSTLYLLLSIFLGISAFLVFANREKDYGMPPRRVVQPVYDPNQLPYREPAEVPQPPQPPQPKPPVQGPWENP